MAKGPDDVPDPNIYYRTQQIATAMHSDTNLVALKTDALIAQGYCLHHQEYENRFLK